MHTSVIAIALVLSAGLGHAASPYIYQWQDEEGQTHMGDSVPKRYRGVATRIEAKQFALPESQRAEAAAREARERKRMAAQEAQRARARSAQPVLPAVPVLPVAPVYPVPPVASGQGWYMPYPGAVSPRESLDTDCDHLWRAYFASQGCFAPFRTRHGIKAEAFQHCKEVANPSYQCGPSNLLGGG